MTKEQVNDCFDLMVANNKSLVKWLPIVGAIFLAVGGGMYFMGSNTDAIIISQIIMAFGAVMTVLITPLAHISSRSAMKRIDRIKIILATEPKKLVWAYIHVVTRNGIKNESVILKCIDGDEIEIVKSVIKNNTSEDFLLSLQSLYNPSMTLGFSEELKQKYLNGQL